MKENQTEDISKVSIVQLSEKWFIDAKVSSKDKEHLLKSLNNLKRGRAPTPSFKLYGSSSRKLVTKFLDSIAWNSIDVPEGWKEYEFDRLSKFGPQGGYRPWEEMRELFHMYQTRLKPCVCNLSVLRELAKSYDSIFCQMLPAKETLKFLIKAQKIQDRAAGCRQFSLKKTDVFAQVTAIKDFESNLCRYFFMYTFSRYYKNKIRLFMPGSFAHMIDQARYVQPFLVAIQTDIEAKRSKSLLRQHSDKIGFSKCFDIMSDEINDMLISSPLSEWTLIYVQGDFEKMDTTTGSDQYINLFIPLMSRAFRYSEKSENYRKLETSMLLTTTVPIASPDGMMTGEHGTGSGMENTNIGEGCCNDYYQLNTIVILTRKCKSESIEFKTAARRVNGDDSAYVFLVKSKSPEILARFKELVQESAQISAEECGFIINDKWRIDENFGLFCQNCFWYDAKLRKVRYMYPSSLILNSIINPEKEYSKSTWDKDYRDIDIIEKCDNGSTLPYFKELVKFVDNGMKFHLLGRSEKETRRILSKYDKYRALQSLHERYNRQDYDITKSPTIRLIKEIRR
jgi:hypothetical protein